METAKTLTASSTTMNDGLGFLARAVRIDNLTSSYVRLTDAAVDVPPWVWGTVVVLPAGVRSARAQLVATTPAITGPPVPIQQATLTWTEDPLPPDPGHLLQSSQYALRQDLGAVTSPANGGTKSTSFPLPAGTTAVSLMMDFSVSGNPASLSIVGDQTNQDYTAANLVLATNPLLGNFGGGPFVYQIVPRDTSVTVSITSSNPGSACTVRVTAYLDEASVFVQQNRGTFFNVSQLGSSPTPWQAPTNTVYGNLTTVTTTVLVAGVATQKIRVWGCQLEYDSGTSAVAVLEDDSRTPPGGRFLVLPDAGKSAVSVNHGGAALPSGAGLRLRVIGITGGGGVSACVGYSQA